MSEAQTNVLQRGLNFAPGPTQISPQRIQVAVENSFAKFTVGEANHVGSKVIELLKNHRPSKPTLNSKGNQSTEKNTQ